MHLQKLVLPLLGSMVILAAAAQGGCGGGNETTASTGTGGSSHVTSSSSSGMGGAGGGGTGGHGGSAVNYGPPATDFVSAGEVSKSASYKLVFTLGQSTQNQEKTTSPSYRLQGGLIGANGSLP